MICLKHRPTLIPPSWKFALSLACRTSFSPGFPPMFLAARAVCSGPLNGRVPQALTFILSSSLSPSVAPTTTFILITPHVLCPDHISRLAPSRVCLNNPKARHQLEPAINAGLHCPWCGHRALRAWPLPTLPAPGSSPSLDALQPPELSLLVMFPQLRGLCLCCSPLLGAPS